MKNFMIGIIIILGAHVSAQASTMSFSKALYCNELSSGKPLLGLEVGPLISSDEIYSQTNWAAVVLVDGKFHKLEFVNVQIAAIPGRVAGGGLFKLTADLPEDLTLDITGSQVQGFQGTLSTPEAQLTMGCQWGEPDGF